jgi:hypothetical protein
MTETLDARLVRIQRQLTAMTVDTQCRDWTADRPDRTTFARIGVAADEVYTYLRTYRPAVPADPASLWLVAGVSIGFPALVLLLADRPAEPLSLVVALVGGVVAAQFAAGALTWWRRWRARRRTVAPALIDDPYRRADLIRRLEQCAADAEPSPAREDLRLAVTWLNLAADGPHSR